MLLAGATRGGKSNLINQMLATLITMNTPDDLRLMLVDLKGGIEFQSWETLPHLVRPMISEVDDVLPSLQWLKEVMEKRFEALRTMSAKNILGYNKVVSAEHRLPRVVCLIDEVASFSGLKSVTEEIHQTIGQITSKGRAVGVHMVLCTQYATKEQIAEYIKANLPLRASTWMPSYQNSMTILNTTTAAGIAKVPGRIVFNRGQQEDVLQSPLITATQIEMAVTQALTYQVTDNTEFEQAGLVMPEPAVSIEDVLQIAIHTLGGKLSEAPIHRALGGNETIGLGALRPIIQQIRDIVDDEGSIEYQGRAYEIRRDRRTYILTPTDTQDQFDDDQTFALSIA
jgi:hypothetical protein